MHSVANDADVFDAVPKQIVARGFAGGPKRNIPIKPVRPALLAASDGAFGPGIKRVPNGSEDLVDICDAIRPAPPGRIPRYAMVLIDNEIEARLLAMPFAGG